MMLGHGTGQIVLMLSAPVITRLYTPKAFGDMTFIIAVGGLFAVVSSFCYHIAIVLPKNEDDAFNLFAISVIANLITVSCVSFSLWMLLSLNWIGYFYKGASEVLWLLPFFIFFTSLRESLSYLNTRYKKFNLISLSPLINAIISAGIQISAGSFFASSVIYLVLGKTAGVIFASLILLTILVQEKVPLYSSIKWSKIKKCLREYIRFPQYHLPTTIFNSLTQQLPIFLFSYFFSYKVVGLYGIANMVLRKPLYIISQSISKVFLKKSVGIEQADNNELAVFFKKSTLGLAAFSAIPFGLLLIAGKPLFGYVFGEKWIEAGKYAQIMTPWLFLMLVKTPANQIIFLKQKLRFNFYFNIAQAVFISLSISIPAYLSQDPKLTLFIFSVTGGVSSFIFIMYVYRILHLESWS